MRPLGAVISVLWLGVATPAAAQNSLDFPPECGSAREFEQEVARRLGDVPLPETRARIEQDGQDYRLRMSVAGELRELRDRNCRELFRAAVVVAVAIAVSESEPETRPPPKPAPLPPPRPASPSPQRAPRPATPEPNVASAAESPSRLRGFLGLGAGVAVGVVPGVVPSLELEAKALDRRFGVAVGARYLAPGSSRDAANRGVEVSALGAELSALFQPIPALETRFGALVLRTFGTGLGSPTQQSDSAWAGGLVAGLAVFPLRRDRFWAGAAAKGEWHLVRSRFEILNYREVFRMPQFGGSAIARFGFRFF